VIVGVPTEVKEDEYRVAGAPPRGGGGAPPTVPDPEVTVEPSVGRSLIGQTCRSSLPRSAMTRRCEWSA
jgi:hypothetical protein